MAVWTLVTVESRTQTWLLATARTRRQYGPSGSTDHHNLHGLTGHMTLRHERGLKCQPDPGICTALGGSLTRSLAEEFIPFLVADNKELVIL